MLGVSLRPQQQAPSGERSGDEYIKQRISSGWKAFGAIKEQLRCPRVAVKLRVKTAVSCILPVMCWGLSALSLLKHERDQLDSVWGHMLAIVMPNQQEKTLPQAIRQVLHIRKIVRNFQHPFEENGLPSPSLRYLQGKLCLAEAVASGRCSPLASAAGWRSKHVWETGQRTRRRFVHRRCGRFQCFEDWLHETFSQFNRPWYDAPPETFTSTPTELKSTLGEH